MLGRLLTWLSWRATCFRPAPAWLALAAWLGLFAVGFGQTVNSPRAFAPGVLTTIPPNLEPDETVSTADIVEIRANAGLEWTPEFTSESRTLFGMSDDVKFRRDVSCLEFSFKPLRMIYVDVPQPTGKMQRKLIWYLVYRLRNTGQVLTSVEQPDGTFLTKIVKGGPVRFVPQFVLESQDVSASGERIHKAYLDRLIPAAMEPIRKRETPDRTLLNSVEMAQHRIPVSDDRDGGGVWGVATWEDVDPRLDFFSVYVGGLSNAYRWFNPPDAYQAGDPPGKGRRFVRKTLQLNFWRPGDEVQEDETEVRFGVPPKKAEFYGVPEGVAFRWVYR